MNAPAPAAPAPSEEAPAGAGRSIACVAAAALLWIASVALVFGEITHGPTVPWTLLGGAWLALIVAAVSLPARWRLVATPFAALSAASILGYPLGGPLGVLLVFSALGAVYSVLASIVLVAVFAVKGKRRAPAAPS